MAVWKMLPTTSAPEAASPPQTTFAVTERLPSEYLIAANGDVREAADLANTTVPEFMRALGADSSIHQVTQSIMFLALLDNLRIMQATSESIRNILIKPIPMAPSPPTRPPTKPKRDPRTLHIVDEDDSYDPLTDTDTEDIPEYDPLLDDEDAQKSPGETPVPFKELARLYVDTGLFIQRAAAQTQSQQPRQSPGRHTPPQSERSQVLEAVRSRPHNQQHTPTITELTSGDEQAIAGLRDRIIDAPDYIKQILGKAARDAGLDLANPPMTSEEDS